MKLYSKGALFLGFLVLFFCIACIPIQDANAIKTYEIKEGNPNKKKAIKKNTQFVFSYYSAPEEVYEYLNKKFPKAFYKEDGLAVVENPFFDVQKTFTFRFYFKKDRDVDLNLISLFSKKDIYDDDDDITYGKYLYFVHITVVDEKGVDALSRKSLYRGRLISYCNELRGGYIQFIKEKKLINQ